MPKIDKVVPACSGGPDQVQADIQCPELVAYLVGRGLPFREAGHLAGQALTLAEERGLGPENLNLEDFRSLSAEAEQYFGPDVYNILEDGTAAKRRNISGLSGSATGHDV